jgi:hypothetical protein
MASSGNFCTLNPLTEYDTRVNRGNYSNGNLTYDDVGGDGWVTNMAMTHKTYCEYRIDGLGGYGGVQGLRGTQAASQVYDSVTFQASYQSGRIYHYKGDSDQSYSGNIGGTVSSGNIIMFAYDPATYKWWVGVNGTWRNSGDPANGTGYVFEGSATMFENMDVTWGGWSGDVNRLDHTWNFGQDSTFGGQETAGGNADGNGFGDFAYAPPTGFLALCTGNMVISDDIDPAQTDDDYPGKNFNTVIYTGNGSTQSITGLGFKPDLVWLKRRDGTKANALFDSNRGVTKYLSSDSQGTGATDTSTLTTFGTDGFSLASPAANNLVNGNGFTYVGWCWKANGGTTSSDSSGDITVTRQSNTKGGFSILTYTGNGSADQTIAHGLGATPAFIITKNTSSNSHWAVWHQSHTGYYGQIEDTGSWASDSSQFYTDGMTSNFIGVKGSGATNDSGSSMLGYVWTEIDGYSKFGSYEGNNNADGPFVYTGGRPRLLMIRNTEQSSNWMVYDTARSTFNVVENYLFWGQSSAEDSAGSSFDIDILSNGFKIRSTEVNLNNTRKYIYACWMDVPFKYNNTF